MTRTIRVSAIRHEGEYAAASQFRQPIKVSGASINGRRVDFIVAGVNDLANRRIDHQTHTIGNGVCDMESIDNE